MWKKKKGKSDGFILIHTSTYTFTRYTYLTKKKQELYTAILLPSVKEMKVYPEVSKLTAKNKNDM